MSIQANRAQRRALVAQSRRQPEALTEVPRHEWPAAAHARQARVWRSRDFLVQEFAEANGVVRLSVNRTRLNGAGRWDDAITWDELQQLKAEAGYGKRCAVEVFPPDGDVVNVANMRHLWLLPELPPFMWRRA